MSDEDSFEQFGVGAYGAVEGNLGDPLKPFLGFGLVRRAQRLEREAAALRARVERLDGQRNASTSPGVVRYVSPDQVETWDAVFGDEAA